MNLSQLGVKCPMVDCGPLRRDDAVEFFRFLIPMVSVSVIFDFDMSTDLCLSNFNEEFKRDDNDIMMPSDEREHITRELQMKFVASVWMFCESFRMRMERRQEEFPSIRKFIANVEQSDSATRQMSLCCLICCVPQRLSAISCGVADM